jgi:Pyruvate/2-oxoacid:ferredoxin oxidoreductase delta subunit
MSEELKPCRFCDSPAEVFHDERPGWRPWVAWCTGCGFSLKQCPTRAEAVRLWNERADK